MVSSLITIQRSYWDFSLRHVVKIAFREHWNIKISLWMRIWTMPQNKLRWAPMAIVSFLLYFLSSCSFYLFHTKYTDATPSVRGNENKDGRTVKYRTPPTVCHCWQRCRVEEGFSKWWCKDCRYRCFEWNPAKAKPRRESPVEKSKTKTKTGLQIKWKA